MNINIFSRHILFQFSQRVWIVHMNAFLVSPTDNRTDSIPNISEVPGSDLTAHFMIYTESFKTSTPVIQDVYVLI
jgi:hypothetical protein